MLRALPYGECARRQLLCSHGECARRQMMMSHDKIENLYFIGLDEGAGHRRERIGG